MKKIIGFFIVLIGFITLVSYRSDVAMFGKAVVPIIFNTDNATNSKSLNLHVRGDSATGYKLWARNNIGSEFFIGDTSESSGSTYVRKSFYTNNNSYAIGDTIVELNGTLIAKQVNFTDTTVINELEVFANLNTEDASTLFSFYLIDTLGIVINNITLKNGVQPAFFGNYTMPLGENISLSPNVNYWIGVYCGNTNTARIPGNKTLPEFIAQGGGGDWYYYTGAPVAEGQEVSLELYTNAINLFFKLNP